ncbi:DUF1361 domain-containing protein [Sporosarcina sp. GW1-11]|uniref:DUF1361 domain-containing protein n=1 Tax=Sporosarcina sp. GW1-11 TaxID=2899126 RepID=UPI00294B9D09|nr:DUF1361 domain-containing protein [Sporosarcina sp. GW1-11]MDV6377886.1 DUF1361 domain-containing protein [Sporosarcina sp. GW1-11]
MGSFFEQYKGVAFFVFVYWCTCFIMFYKDPNFLYIMLSWNILLAVLPLYFIGKAEVTMNQRKMGSSIFWLGLWLFFFPNSVYLVTDFIHISNDKFLWLVEVERYSSDSGVVYSHEIIVWAKLLVIGFGFFFALVVGLESFYIFEKVIRKNYSKSICYVGMLVVTLLTGIGVYIGRFLRFNSWDILFNPLQLLKQVAVLDGFAAQFIGVFTIFVIGCYTLHRMFRNGSFEK